MSKKRQSGMLHNAQKYTEYLLYEATGGSIGKQLKSKESGEVIENNLTFPEKRALLESMLKLAALENKLAPEEEDSALDHIRRELNGSGEIKSGRGHAAS